MKKAFSGVILILLFAGMSALVFNIQPVKPDYTWTETIYIRADGSVQPDTAPVSSADNVIYSFTDNIVGDIPEYTEAIVVQRNNIVVDGAGYTLRGVGDWGSIGIYSLYKSNVTIKNITIKQFNYGVYLESSNNNSISGNNITANNNRGVYLESSNNNSISGNNITANIEYGILLSSSSNNVISGNNIIGNYLGIGFKSSSNNVISGNNIGVNYFGGIVLLSPSSNKFFHNNIYNNAINQVWVSTTINVWDDGYPSGGNYWSDYSGADLYNGPYQNETGSDGMGDTPYVINANNQDNYPLVTPPIQRNQHDIGITSIDPFKTVVGEGFTAQVNVTVFNYGNHTENFNLTAYARTSTIGAITNITLTSGKSTTITFTLSTSGFAKGVYYLSAYATPVPNETYTTDNTYTHSGVLVTAIGDVDGNRRVDVIDQRKVAIVTFTIPEDPLWDYNMDIDDNLRVDVIDQRLQMIHMFEQW